MDSVSDRILDAIERVLAPQIDAIARGTALRAEAASPPVLWFCPNPECISNVPMELDGEVWYYPSLVRAAEPQRCSYCSTPLRCACPHCHEPVVEGAFCRNLACGAALVTPPAGTPQGEEGRRAADARRARIRELRELTRLRDHPLVEGRRREEPPVR
jgi:hypothetical protein